MNLVEKILSAQVSYDLPESDDIFCQQQQREYERVRNHLFKVLNEDISLDNSRKNSKNYFSGCYQNNKRW